MSFLTAEWRKLAIANYEVEPGLLKKHLPDGTELDLWNGTCYVSLVGFMFLNTRVLGLSVPFHRNFEEVNLRFYVRHKDKKGGKRGVVFIKEIVPRPAISFVANTIYREHYQTMKMSHIWTESAYHRTVKYAWGTDVLRHSFLVNAELGLTEIASGSEAEFITEHYWGYTKAGKNTTLAYEVVHPKWSHYPVLGFEINVDFASVYGQEFHSLTTDRPKSVMLAEGSLITVEKKAGIHANKG